MALRLLIDECMLEKLLGEKLKAAGHDLLTVTDAGLTGKPDHAVFEKAISENRMVLTLNCSDFAEIADAKIQKNIAFPSPLLVYRNNVPGKEMSHDEIVTALANLEGHANVPSSGVSLSDCCHVLNHYLHWPPQPQS